MHYSRLWRATGARGFAARPRRIATVQAHAYHRRMNPMSWQTHCDRTATKAVAVASTLALIAVILASASWAQTKQPQTHSRPHEVSAAAPSNVNAGGREPVIAGMPFVQPVLVARRFCYDEPGAPQRSPLGAAAPVHGTAGGFKASNATSLGPAAQAGSERRWTTQNTGAGQMATGSSAHANAGWLVTTQPREDLGRGVQSQVQAAASVTVTPPQQPRPAQQPAPAPGLGYDGRVACEPGYPQLDSGLVLDLLIGIGAHHGVPRHDGRGGRVP
jgi:hypothetical protein